jgi:beta-lactam-binding protein with PASTA domain
VPDVRGLSLRQAARALHEAGLRVQLVAGVPGTTSPGAGSMVPAGSIVRMASTP